MAKTLRLALGILHLITALGALPAGALFVLDPSGSLMGMSAESLAGSPFATFLIPGIFLLLINGIGQGFAAYLYFKADERAPRWGIFFGILLLGWILIQVMIIGYTSLLQPLFGLIGLVQIITGPISFRR